MKSKNLIIYIGLAGIIISGMLIYSCTQKSLNSGDNSQIPDKVIDKICSTCESHDFWLPDKTKIERVEGKNGNRIIFTAPEGYIYYGFAIDSSLIVWNNKEQGGGSVTVTCDCTNGSDDDCSPVGHNGKVSCIISAGCTTCKRIEKATDPVTKTEYEILSGGFVNPSLGVSFAQPGEEIPYAFKALLYYPEIKQQLNKFMLQFYADLKMIPETVSNEESIAAPEGYKFVVLNVYGRALVTLIPESKGINAAGGHTYTCPCNGTSGTCKEKSFMGYHFCEKPDSNPCNKACNTMTVKDDKKGTLYTYTYYYF